MAGEHSHEGTHLLSSFPVVFLARWQLLELLPLSFIID